MNAVQSWYLHFDFISLLIGAVLGMFLGTWYSHFVKRPRLVLHGNGGSGGGVGLRTANLNFTNVPRFIGIQVRPTTIFGRKVHGLLRWGIPVDTVAMRQLNATLFDKESGEMISQLYWQRGKMIAPTIDLDSGEQVSLLVFSRFGQDPTRYFPFRPESDGAGSEFSENGGYFDQPKKFEIRINYAQAQKPIKIQCSVSRRFTGGFWVESRGGGGML